MTVTLHLNSQATDSSTRRTLSDLSLAVAKSKKIVVVTGAGISCSCGIPDFRSSDGLYNLVRQQYPDVVVKGRDLFDASLFRDPASASVFYTFISQLKRSIDVATPAPTHKFINTLNMKGKLLRSYTQNIDGLEVKAGLLGSASQEAKSNGKGKCKIRTKDVKNVQLHGDIHRVRCSFCSADFPCSEEYLRVFDRGVPPDCPECFARSEARVARSARALRIGTLRPAIVLYGEAHPLGDDIGTIQLADMSRKPDMILIMGTSLKVHGLKKLVKDFAKSVHALSSHSLPPSAASHRKTGTLTGKVMFVNKTPPGAEWADVIDYFVCGETDRWVEKVMEDWKKMRPADWEVQKTLDGIEGAVSTAGFKVVKENVTTKGKGNKKKSAHGMENIPPADLFNASEIYSKSTAAPPLSPSKRSRVESHYCDIESSPSKKRDVVLTAAVQKMSMEERGLLFGDSTNANSDGGGCEEMGANSRVGGSRKKVVAAGKEQRDMWVEVQVPMK